MFRAIDRSVEQFIAMFLPMSVALACFVPVQAQQVETKAQSAETVTVPAQTMERLQQHLADLESEVQQLKAQMKDVQSANSVARQAGALSGDDYGHSTAESVAQSASPAQSGALLSADDRSVLDYLKGTTINVSIDGYYAWNFNRPVGRVNLLRAYDVSSNAFSLNQAAVIFERAPDVATNHVPLSTATSSKPTALMSCPSAAVLRWILGSGPARSGRKETTLSSR